MQDVKMTDQIAGHENKRQQDVKMQDMKMQDMKLEDMNTYA